MTRATGFRVYGAAAGGGGGSTTYNQHTIAFEWTEDASYPTGGFVVDLTKTFSTINFFDNPIVKKGSRGANLPAVRYEITRNSPVAGKATIKIVRKRYDRTSTVGNVSGQPVGVTVQATSGVASSSESSHTHSIDHNHGSFTSGAASTGAGQVLLDVLGPSLATHTHTLDLPNLTGTSGAGTSHNHTDNSIYAHSHSITQTSTSYASSELPNGTNLSGTTWYMCVSGVKV